MGCPCSLCMKPCSTGLTPCRTLPCPPAVPQQKGHSHFPREATRPNLNDPPMQTRASLNRCLDSGFHVLGASDNCSCKESGQTQFGSRVRLGGSHFTPGSVLGLPASPFPLEAGLWEAVGPRAWSVPIQAMPGICPAARFSSLRCLFRDTVCLSD